MISKKLRLHGTRTAYLLSKGKRINQDHLSARILPSRGEASRFCIVISSKTAPKAHTRNRLRRQIYEIMRLNQVLLETPKDLAIICKKTCLELDFEHLQNNLIKLFIDINKLK